MPSTGAEGWLVLGHNTEPSARAGHHKERLRTIAHAEVEYLLFLEPNDCC